MSLIVLTGGVRSGKSAAAERLAILRKGPVVVAVAGWEGDEEMARRLAAHAASRPAGFTVRTVGPDPEWIAGVAPGAVLVLDCLATLVGAIVHEEVGEATLADAAAEERCEARAMAIVDGLIARGGDTIVVTNEAGWGVVPAFASGRVFRDTLGRVNRALMAHADGAWLTVAGRLLDLQSLPSEAAWPHSGHDDHHADKKG